MKMFSIIMMAIVAIVAVLFTAVNLVTAKKAATKKAAAAKRTERHNVPKMNLQRFAVIGTNEVAEKLKAVGLNATQARAIMAALKPVELGNIVADKNIAELTRIKGIGEKTAEKVLTIKGLPRNYCEQLVHVPGKVMMTYKKYSINENFNGNNRMFVCEEIRGPIGPAMQFAVEAAKNGDMPFFIVNTTTPSSILKDEGLTALVEYNLDNLKRGWTIDGVKYIQNAHGTNAGRKNEVMWVPDYIQSDLQDYDTCGMRKTAKFVPSKFGGYRGLLMVATTAFGVPIKPNQVAVFKGLKKVIKDKVAFVENGKVTFGERDVVQECFDGMALFSMGTNVMKKLRDSMSEEAWNKVLENWASFTTCTFRGPWLKGIMSRCFDVQKFLKDNGITKVQTVDGTWVNVDDIVVFADESVFKAPLGKDINCAYDDWAQFCDAFNERNHEIRRLLESHSLSRNYNLAYQPFQGLNAAIDMVGDVAAIETHYLNGLNNAKTMAKELGGRIAQLGAKNPDIMGVRYFREKAEERYTKRYREMLGGKIHNVSKFAFCVSDPLAFCQHIAGMEVTGFIKANTVFVPTENKYFVDGAEAVLGRYPNTNASALCVVTIRSKVPNVVKDYIVNDDVIIMSIWDTNATKMRCDFDGDHLFLTKEEAIVKAVKLVHERFGDFVNDWIAPKAQKVVCDRNTMLEYFRTLTTVNQLGSNNLTLAKAYNNLLDTPELVAMMDYIINVLVDCTKHGGNLDKALNDAFRDIKKLKLPRYVAAAKDIDEPKTYGKHLDDENTEKEYSDSFVGKMIKTTIDNTSDKLEMEVDGEFNYRCLLFDKNIQKHGYFEHADLWGILAHKKTSIVNGKTVYIKDDKGKFIYEENGLFTELAVRDYNEWKEEGVTKYIERGIKTFEAVEAYAVKHGISMRNAYDMITYTVFNSVDKTLIPKDNKIKANNLFEMWVCAFGKMATEAMAENAGVDYSEYYDDAPFVDIDAD